MKKEVTLKPSNFFIYWCVLVLIIAGSCRHNDDQDSDENERNIVSSRAYKGHASDADMNNFVQAYNNVRATRLDDCQTCHRSGSASADKGEQYFNPCDYCHLMIHHEGITHYPTTPSETLNNYGADYKASGRNKNAIQAIGSKDSDGDGYTNKEEINDLRYPGDDTSYPGLALCSLLQIGMDEIKALPAHTQFGLANANKQQFDYYATYTGVKLADLFQHLGIDLAGATSVDILAPDGYSKSFSIEEILQPFPAHRYFSGFGVEDLSADCAFVEYPSETYSYGYGDFIDDEQWHILAYEREGQVLETAYLDITAGKIYGEGPYRNVIPPGAEDEAMNQPDRGKYANTDGCTLLEWNYDDGKDHNAGAMVKGAVIIRIQPMPADCEEFDIQNGGWSLVEDKKVYIYGYNVSP